MGLQRWNTLVMDFTGFHVWRWAIQWNFIMNNGDFMRFNDWTWGFSEPTTLGRPVFCTPTDAVWFFTSHGSQALSLSRFHQSLCQALIAKQQQEEGASPQLLATAKSSTGMAPLASWCSCQKIWQRISCTKWKHVCLCPSHIKNSCQQHRHPWSRKIYFSGRIY